MQVSVDIKQQIIDVADTRFRRYGFGKTTMAEIAKDCDMSAANLYRYFENKQKIGVEIAENCMRNKEKVGRDVLRKEKITASARLEHFFQEILRYTHDLCADDPHLFELVSFISQEHPELVQKHKASLCAFIAEILAEGNRSGEFEVSDIIATAQTLLFATIHFYYPPLVAMKSPSLEELNQASKDVVALIIQGIAKH